MKKSIFEKAVASAVASAVIILSPGVACYEAAAQTIQRVPLQTAGAPVSYGPVQAWTGGGAVRGSVSNAGTLSLTPGVAGILAAPSVEAGGAVEVKAAAILPATALAPRSPVSPLATLSASLKAPAPAPSALPGVDQVGTPALERVGAGQTLDRAAQSVPVLASPDTPEAEAKAESAKAFDALKAKPGDGGPAVAAPEQGPADPGSALGRPAAAAADARKAPIPLPARLRGALTRPATLLWLGQAVGMSALAALTGTWIVPAVAGVAFNLATTAVTHYRRAARGFRDDGRGPPQEGPLKPGAWVPRVALMAALFTLLDWGVKYMFLTMGLPIVYHDMVPFRVLMMKLTIPLNIAGAAYFTSLAHSSKPFFGGLDAWCKRHRVLGAVVKAALWIATFPMGVNDKRYGGDLAGKDPVVGKVLGLIGILSAALVASGFGNGVEGILNGRVIDFIPFGRGRANIADLFIFLGMPLLWMGLDFLKAARLSGESGKPMSFKLWKYFALPVLGSVAFVYSTMAGYDAIPMPAWYLLIFSVLFSVGILLGSAVIGRFVDAFNQRFGPKEGKQS